jgi:hypothetical protein
LAARSSSILTWISSIGRSKSKNIMGCLVAFLIYRKGFIN